MDSYVYLEDSLSSRKNVIRRYSLTPSYLSRLPEREVFRETLGTIYIEEPRYRRKHVRRKFFESHSTFYDLIGHDNRGLEF